MAGCTYKRKRGRRRPKTRRRTTRRRKGGVGTPDGKGPIGRMPNDFLSLVAEHTPTRALARFAQTSRRHRDAAARELSRRRRARELVLATEAPVPLDATVEIGIAPTDQEAVRTVTVPFGRMYRRARHARTNGYTAKQVAWMLLDEYGVGDPCFFVRTPLLCTPDSQLWPLEMWALFRTLVFYQIPLDGDGVQMALWRALQRVPIGGHGGRAQHAAAWTAFFSELDVGDFDGLYERMIALGHSRLRNIVLAFDHTSSVDPIAGLYDDEAPSAPGSPVYAASPG